MTEKHEKMFREIKSYFEATSDKEPLVMHRGMVFWLISQLEKAQGETYE